MGRPLPQTDYFRVAGYPPTIRVGRRPGPHSVHAVSRRSTVCTIRSKFIVLQNGKARPSSSMPALQKIAREREQPPRSKSFVPIRCIVYIVYVNTASHVSFQQTTAEQITQVALEILEAEGAEAVT